VDAHLVGLALTLCNRHEKMNNLICMSYTNRGTSELLVGGLQRTMVTVNLDRGAVVSEVTANLGPLETYPGHSHHTYDSTPPKTNTG